MPAAEAESRRGATTQPPVDVRAEAPTPARIGGAWLVAAALSLLALAVRGGRRRA